MSSSSGRRVVVFCCLVATIVLDYCYYDDDGVRVHNNGAWFVVGAVAARPILVVGAQLETISTSSTSTSHDGHVAGETNASKPATSHLLSIIKDEDNHHDDEDEKAARQQKQQQQQRYVKELGMLGITYCKCCDYGGGVVGASSHEDQCKIVSLGNMKELASCSKLECLPWKLH